MNINLSEEVLTEIISKYKNNDTIYGYNISYDYLKERIIEYIKDGIIDEYFQHCKNCYKLIKRSWKLLYRIHNFIIKHEYVIIGYDDIRSKTYSVNALNSFYPDNTIFNSSTIDTLFLNTDFRISTMKLLNMNLHLLKNMIKTIKSYKLELVKHDSLL